MRFFTKKAKKCGILSIRTQFKYIITDTGSSTEEVSDRPAKGINTGRILKFVSTPCRVLLFLLCTVS
jgi:hypothetical protein